jgi:thioredoxin 1
MGGLGFPHVSPFLLATFGGNNVSKATPVSSATWSVEVDKAEGLVLVDFWAVWCGPCPMVGPIVDELATEYNGKLKVMKLNTDENPDVAGRYQIMSIPTLLFFRGGQAVDKVVGAVPKKILKDAIDRLLAPAA